MQSKKHSVYEAWTNGIVGFVISTGLMTLWLWYPPDAKWAPVVVATFTGASVLRSYIIRRIFNAF